MIKFIENVGGFEVQNVPEYANEKRYWVIKCVDHVVWFHAAADDKAEAEKLSVESGQSEAFVMDRAEMFTPYGEDVERLKRVAQVLAKFALNNQNHEDCPVWTTMGEVLKVMDRDLAHKCGLDELFVKTDEAAVNYAAENNINAISINGDSVSWVYYNPDGDKEDGQFVEMGIGLDEISKALADKSLVFEEGNFQIFDFMCEYGRVFIYEPDQPEWEPIKSEFVDTLNGVSGSSRALDIPDAEWYIYQAAINREGE